MIKLFIAPKLINKAGYMKYKDKILLPGNVGHVINKLNEAGFEAYIVGGCVRDYLLERKPCDWDVATSALPGQIKSIFDKTYDTGIKHGTVSVSVDNALIEVTSFRIDGEYSDNRRPDHVSFTSSLKEDLARRDFTVNAMAYSPKAGLIDYFNGRTDLENRTIKAVGEARQRFREDALRMLRAVRFSAQLGFDLEKNTYAAIGLNSKLIKNISRERVRDELNKLLISDRPGNFNLIYTTGLLEYIIPEFTACYTTEQANPYHVYNVAEHILRTVEYVENSSLLRWTMLLHDIGKPSKKTTDEKGIDHFYGHQEESCLLAESILNRLRFDRESIKKIVVLIRKHDLDIEDTPKSVRKMINKVGEELFLELLKVKRADAMAQNRIYLDKRLIKIDNIKRIYHNIKSRNQCISKADMAVNGNDLIGLGMKPGMEIGKILDYLFESVLDNPKLNKKEKLIALAKKYGNL